MESVRSRCQRETGGCLPDAAIPRWKGPDSFGVFEVNRVNFMRHGGRTNLTSNGFLFEVVKGDITPDVTVKVDQNGVEARNAIKQFSNVVVRFDLGGVQVPLNTQRGDELFAELMPVNFRVSGDMGVIVTIAPLILRRSPPD